MACAPSEDSDQPGHPPSLIRVFTVRMKKHWVLSTHWAHWLDSDQSLRCPHEETLGSQHPLSTLAWLWSESSLSAWRNIGFSAPIERTGLTLIRVFAVRMKKHWVLSTHWAHWLDSDQTGQMPESSLGAQLFLLVLSRGGSYILGEQCCINHCSSCLNRLNKTQSGIFVSCVISLLPTDPFYRKYLCIKHSEKVYSNNLKEKKIWRHIPGNARTCPGRNNIPGYAKTYPWWSNITG